MFLKIRHADSCCALTLPFSESSLSEESLLSEDEDPVFIFVTFVVSRGFSAATKHTNNIQKVMDWQLLCRHTKCCQYEGTKATVSYTFWQYTWWLATRAAIDEWTHNNDANANVSEKLDEKIHNVLIKRLQQPGYLTIAQSQASSFLWTASLC